MRNKIKNTMRNYKAKKYYFLDINNTMQNNLEITFDKDPYIINNREASIDNNPKESEIEITFDKNDVDIEEMIEDKMSLTPSILKDIIKSARLTKIEKELTDIIFLLYQHFMLNRVFKDFNSLITCKYKKCNSSFITSTLNNKLAEIQIMLCALGLHNYLLKSYKPKIKDLYKFVIFDSAPSMFVKTTLRTLAVQKGEKVLSDKTFYKMIKIFTILTIPMTGENFTNNFLSRVKCYSSLPMNDDKIIKFGVTPRISFNSNFHTGEKNILLLNNIISEDDDYIIFEAKYNQKMCIASLSLNTVN